MADREHTHVPVAVYIGQNSKEDGIVANNNTPNDYLKEIDWDSAIAAADIEIKKGEASGNVPFDTYLDKGIALCLKDKKESKDGKYQDAIDALSRVIAASNENEEKARYYRAYAYYLSGNYERALKDCQGNKYKVLMNALKGKILFAMERYYEAAEILGDALKEQLPDNLPSPGLLDDYRESCKRMNNQ